MHFSILSAKWSLFCLGFHMLSVTRLGPDSIQRCRLNRIQNPIVEMRRSYDRLVSMVGFCWVWIITSGCVVPLPLDWGQSSSCQGPTHLRLFLLLSSVTTRSKLLVSLHVLWVLGRCGVKLYALAPVKCSLILHVKDRWQYLAYIYDISIDPLQAELVWETTKIYLHFLSFLITEQVHTVYTLSCGRKRSICNAGSILWLLMTWARFNIKMPSYQYRKSHCGDKTVVRSSYLHNGISYTGKTTSLHWIRSLLT